MRCVTTHYSERCSHGSEGSISSRGASRTRNVSLDLGESEPVALRPFLHEKSQREELAEPSPLSKRVCNTF